MRLLAAATVGSMQLIEATDYAVRSAALRLARRDAPLRFEIFPMVHLAEPAFYAAVTDRLSLDDTDLYDPPPGCEELLDLIVARRDRLLMNALEAVHEVHSGDPLTVSVVYGAYHVPAIIHGLRGRYGYTVRDAEWLTVFPIEQPRG